MNTYTWEFPNLTTQTSFAGQNNVVHQVHWRLNATDNKDHFASVYGVQYFTYTEGEPFIPFNELTYDIVLNWVTESIGSTSVDSFKASLDAQIEEQITPKIVNQRPPWAPPVFTMPPLHIPETIPPAV
jgi:hypothetical protein